MEVFFSYHDARKIDYNWKIVFIHLESSETIIICISPLIMRLWGLTFHLEMRESNHEFIFLHISTRLRTARRRKWCRRFQTYGICDALPPFNLKVWMFRLCFLLRMLFLGQRDQHVLCPSPSIRVGFYPEAKLLQSSGLKRVALITYTCWMCRGLMPHARTVILHVVAPSNSIVLKMTVMTVTLVGEWWKSYFNNGMHLLQSDTPFPLPFLKQIFVQVI